MSINQLQAINDAVNYSVQDTKRKQVVCMHWYKNKCTRGEKCDFLHSYD